MPAPYQPFDPASGKPESFDLQTLAKELMHGESFHRSGRIARTLVRADELTTVLVAMRKGGEMHEHTAPGPAIVTVLSGEVSFKFENTPDLRLSEGSSVVFAQDEPHRVSAREDCAFLLVVGGRRKEEE